MELSKEKLFKDLGLESAENDVKEAVSQAFSQVVMMKLRMTAVESLSDEQLETLKSASDEEAEKIVFEEALGGELDKLIDSIYDETLQEYKADTQKTLDSLKKS